MLRNSRWKNMVIAYCLVSQCLLTVLFVGRLYDSDRFARRCLGDANH